MRLSALCLITPMILIIAGKSMAQGSGGEIGDEAKVEDRKDSGADSIKIKNDPILSNLYVSPAQSWQTEFRQFHFAYAGISGKIKYDAESASATTNVKGTGTVIGLISPVPSTKIVAGIQYSSINTAVSRRVDDASGDSILEAKDKYTQTRLNPFGSYALNPQLQLGVSFDIVNAKDSPETGKSETYSFNTVEYGVTYHEKSFEIGLMYTPTININETNGSHSEVGSTLLHFQKRFSEFTSVGGIIALMRYYDLDDETNNNIVVYNFSIEHDLSPELLVGLNLGYQPSYVDEKIEMVPGNISSTSWEVSARYTSDQFALGVSYGQEKSGEQSGSIEIDEKIEDVKMANEYDTVVVSLSYSGF